MIETPKGSRNKFDYDPGCAAFRLSGVLPEGMSFPYDFGFIPSTLGDDGDPLDVLILLDTPVVVGCVLTGRLIGVIEAEQRERDGTWTQNHRLVGSQHMRGRMSTCKRWTICGRAARRDRGILLAIQSAERQGVQTHWPGRAGAGQSARRARMAAPTGGRRRVRWVRNAVLRNYTAAGPTPPRRPVTTNLEGHDPPFGSVTASAWAS